MGLHMIMKQISGIVYYHNNIDRNELPDITKFLEEKDLVVT